MGNLAQEAPGPPDHRKPFIRGWDVATLGEIEGTRVAKVINTCISQTCLEIVSTPYGSALYAAKALHEPYNAKHRML